MIYIKKIDNDIAQISALGDISRAYAIIASLRMKNVRQSVLSTRDYLDSIRDIFNEVYHSYRGEVLKLLSNKQKRSGDITFLSHNGRTVCVFLSSNARFYGDLLTRTFELFRNDITKVDVEVTIIGRYGLNLFRQAEPERPYTFFDLPDQGWDPSMFISIIKHLVQYEEIRIYYPKFESVVNQVPTSTKLSASLKSIEDDKTSSIVSYVFEPSLERVMVFFESQMFQSLFEQSIREAQLAKYASRLLSMDKAREKVEQKLKEYQILRLKVMHEVSDRKQMASLAPVYFSRNNYEK